MLFSPRVFPAKGAGALLGAPDGDGDCDGDGDGDDDDNNDNDDVTDGDRLGETDRVTLSITLEVRGAEGVGLAPAEIDEVIDIGSLSNRISGEGKKIAERNGNLFIECWNVDSHIMRLNTAPVLGSDKSSTYGSAQVRGEMRWEYDAVHSAT